MALRETWLLDDMKTFDRLRQRLVSTADQKTADILLFEPDLTDEQLVQILRSALMLEPLELEEPNAVRIELEPKAERAGKPLYLHQMTARYRGSRTLWKARPTPRTLLMLSGKVSEMTLTAEDWLPDRQFDQFEAKTRRLLDEVRAALPLQEPAIEAFNAELADFCPRYVPAQFEELVGWRRRGRQLREREERLGRFRESQPDIDPVVPEWKRLVADLIKRERHS